MFEPLKKAFTAEKMDLHEAPRVNAVAEWAGAHGLSYSGEADGKRFTLTGTVGGRPWKLERSRSTRDYIEGDELRVRAELRVHDDASVLIMSRPLKETLDRRAYAMYTDTLQTTVDPKLPEEMRWMALYPEVGWDRLPKVFWSRYSVMSDRRNYAMDWIDPDLAAMLVSGPERGPESQLPFIMMLLRGKAYLRMQFAPDDIATLARAAAVFTKACESAVARLSTDILL